MMSSFTVFYLLFLTYRDEAHRYLRRNRAHCTNPGPQTKETEQMAERQFVGETETFGVKPAPVPLRPPKIQHELARD
jgi:hypothetical protein